MYGQNPQQTVIYVATVCCGFLNIEVMLFESSINGSGRQMAAIAECFYADTPVRVGKSCVAGSVEDHSAAKIHGDMYKTSVGGAGVCPVKDQISRFKLTAPNKITFAVLIDDVGLWHSPSRFAETFCHECGATYALFNIIPPALVGCAEKI